MNPEEELRGAPVGWAAQIVRYFLTGKLSILFIVASFLAGAFALVFTPREEDPQIVVPLVDVIVQVPGGSVTEIERLATGPLEQILAEIPGVENVYSITRPGLSITTARFYVGEDREKSLTKVITQLEANRQRVPPGIPDWQIVPVDIDDVPILCVTFYSRTLDDHALRRVALEVQEAIHAVPDAGKATVTGGASREVRIVLDPTSLTAYGLSPLEVMAAVRGANEQLPAGRTVSDTEIVLYAGPFLRSAADVTRLVVGVHDGAPVYLSQVAEVFDQPEERVLYTRFGLGPAAAPPVGYAREHEYAAVTLAVAKRKGSNAVTVADDVLRRIERMKGSIIPSDVEFFVMRNYGENANHKVNELAVHLGIAVITVTLLLGLTLGWKESLVVALAVPMTLSLTLLCDMIFGYTINGVTLFALILSLGLLVDDPIVDVENIFRHFKLRTHPPLLATLVAVDEIRPPTILATFAVMVCFIPMFYVTGMMGPYVEPMAFNVPVAMFVSLVVAFTVTPWAAYHALRKEYDRVEEKVDIHATRLYRAYRSLLEPLITSRRLGLLFLLGVLLAFLGAVSLAVFGFVPVKMLPFANKNELQVVVDMPEGTAAERTDALVAALCDRIRQEPEVRAYTIYSGTYSPIDFNGMSRHYFLRSGGNVADIRVKLLDKEERAWQAHAIALRLRPGLEEVAARYPGAVVKIVEVPPGPPVLATLVAEVYGPPGVGYDKLMSVAEGVRAAMRATPGITEIDASIEDTAPRADFEIDRDKAALLGVDFDAAVQTLRIALAGAEVGAIRDGAEREPPYIRLRLPQEKRAGVGAFENVRVKSRNGELVPLGEIARPIMRHEEQTVYHKDLRPVVYVYGEPRGQSPVEALFAVRRRVDVPEGFEVNWRGEGEWKATVEVFRDLAMVFSAALVFIYILLVAQTSSFVIPIVIMLSIPLTMIGIFPGFWLLNVLFGEPVAGMPNPIFFTATGVIGTIALAGIVVRNSIILIDFIQVLRAQGKTLEEALIEAGAVRIRPIFLTAGAALFGAWVIVLDPVFSGLAWSLIFGIFASTLFTLLVIPVVYHLLEAKGEYHA